MYFHHAVGFLRPCVQKGDGTTGVLDRRARERKKQREIRLHREPITTEDRWLLRDTAQQTQRTRAENDTDGHNQRICTYERKKITAPDITTHSGAQTNTTKTDRAANRCRSLCNATHRTEERVGGAAGRTQGCPRTARSLHETCTGTRRSRRQRKQEGREKLRVGSAALRPLRANFRVARCWLSRLLS